MPSIHYMPDSMELEVESGQTILEASLAGGIPNTHVCGGNARCSTCRVVILAGADLCLPRNEREQKLADLLQFDASIRLACQTRITGDVRLRRLVLDDEDILLDDQTREGIIPTPVGDEHSIAILFSDIRGFTPFTENLLPYDVIHVLNRYFHLVGEVIKREGGMINNYMGDGIMALFGVENTQDAALRAVRAGLGMLDEVEKLEPYLEYTYGKHFEIGVGIHFGEAVIGKVGATDNKVMTAIGDAVNFASRIESANKEAGTRLLISEDTYNEVADYVEAGHTTRVTLKGKSGAYTLYEIVGLRR